MHGHELLQALRTIAVTPQAVKDLAEKVANTKLVGVSTSQMGIEIVLMAARRAKETQDEQTIAGLMLITYYTGLWTAREVAARS